MKSIARLAFVAMLAMACSLPVRAADAKGSPEEAIALVKKAVTLIKEQGAEKAYAEISNPKGAFVDRDLYAFVFDTKAIVLAHGANAKLIKKDLSELRDADGKYFLKALIELANTKGKGWVDYKWLNPTTKAIEQKSTYIEKVGDVIVGCGIYK